MTDPQLEAVGLLTTAGQLHARAVRLAFQALDHDSRWTAPDDQVLQRAAALATVAAAGARIAHGLIAVEHVDLLREYEARIEERAEGFLAVADRLASEDDHPPARADAD